jgi:hypothetical protein
MNQLLWFAAGMAIAAIFACVIEALLRPKRTNVIVGGPSVVLPKGGYVCIGKDGEARVQFSTGKSGSIDGCRYVRVDHLFAE